MTIYLTKKLEKDIDCKVLEWHYSTGPESLSQYLHMTEQEYKDFVEWNIEIIPDNMVCLNNNGKGWNIIHKDYNWIGYDKHSNRFCLNWCSYYETKEEAEEVKAKLINE